MTWPRRRSKYGNKKTTVDGHTFDSRAEARRYQELILMQRGQLIRNLEIHPRWDLVVNGVRIGRYTGDFAYDDVASGRQVVEDVKGYRSRDVSMRYKLMRACHGIEVTEISSRRSGGR